MTAPRPARRESCGQSKTSTPHWVAAECPVLARRRRGDRERGRPAGAGRARRLGGVRGRRLRRGGGRVRRRRAVASAGAGAALRRRCLGLSARRLRHRPRHAAAGDQRRLACRARRLPDIWLWATSACGRRSSSCNRIRQRQSRRWRAASPASSAPCAWIPITLPPLTTWSSHGCCSTSCASSSSSSSSRRSRTPVGRINRSSPSSRRANRPRPLHRMTRGPAPPESGSEQQQQQPAPAPDGGQEEPMESTPQQDADQLARQIIAAEEANAELRRRRQLHLLPVQRDW